MGVPRDEVLFIRDRYNCVVFVETGTYQGGTAVWAAGQFDQVHTIEFSKPIFEETAAKYQSVHNISFYYGDTRKVLTEILDKQSAPAILWLDAHWCSGITFGEEDQCPLLDEIRVINARPEEHFILIDDARLFLAPPPLPHRLDQYPAISEILAELNCKERFVAVYDDVIFAIPARYGTAFRQYLQTKISTDLAAPRPRTARRSVRSQVAGLVHALTRKK
jgi:hypothetical protein